MAKTKKEKKVFVLDTSVIIYEHNSILNFDEHDVGIPITVLEELDNFKKGNDTKNFEAREFIRLIDKLAKGQMLHNWNPINGKGKGNFKVLMDTKSAIDANKIFNEEKADHRILNSALQLQKESKERKIILVSKDVNLRLKAKALGLQSEDYTTGKVQNISSLYTGKTIVEEVDANMINLLYEKGYCPPGELLGHDGPSKKSLLHFEKWQEIGVGILQSIQ